MQAALCVLTEPFAMCIQLNLIRRRLFNLRRNPSLYLNRNLLLQMQRLHCSRAVNHCYPLLCYCSARHLNLPNYCQSMPRLGCCSARHPKIPNPRQRLPRLGCSRQPWLTRYPQPTWRLARSRSSPKNQIPDSGRTRSSRPHRLPHYHPRRPTAGYNYQQ